MGFYQQTGLDNIVVADNIDLTGGSSPTGMLAADGEFIIGVTGGNPQSNPLTPGSGIDIVNTPGNAEIKTTGGGIDWIEVTDATVSLAVNTGYVMNRATAIDGELPVTAAFGSIIRIAGKGAGLTHISLNAGQTIHFGSSDTTTGVGGSLDATNRYDTLELVCITADLDFVVLSSIGSWTVT